MGLAAVAQRQEKHLELEARGPGSKGLDADDHGGRIVGRPRRDRRITSRRRHRRVFEQDAAAQLMSHQGTQSRPGETERVGARLVDLDDECIPEDAADGAWVDVDPLGRGARAPELSQ